jgi:type IV pilus assembly protein PilB
LCEGCKKPADIPEQALLKAGYKKEELAGIQLHAPVGCDGCSDGYKGRVGIYQVMPVSEATQQIIMSGGNQLDIEKQAKKEAVFDWRVAALNKARQGITSLEEVERVTNL